VAALAVAPDGRTVAAGSGPEVRLWDAGAGQHLRTLPIPGGKVHALALLPDQRFMVVSVENAPLALWDLASGQAVRSWTRHTGYAMSLAALPGGGFVVSGGSDRVVRLWDVASGRPVREMAGHEDAVTAVAAGTAHLASASRDGTVRLWALEGGRCLGVLRGHEGRVLAVALDEGRARVVSAGEDGTVRDWGLRSHEAVRVYRSHAQPVSAVALSPDGASIYSASGDRTARAFLSDGERLASLVRLGSAVHALAVAPDGTVWAAYGTTVAALSLGPFEAPAAALCRPTSASEVEARASSAEARLEEARRLLASGDFVTAVSLARRARSVPGHERSDAALAVWDDLCARLPRRALHSAWEAARLEGHEDQVLGVAVDPTGARALTAGLDATVRSWDLAGRRAEAALAGHDGAATAVAFAGAGHALSGGRDRTVRLWDLAAARALAVLEGHADTVMSLDASADGARAASAAADGTVRLWDLRRRTVSRVLEGHGAPVAAVRLSPDGQVVASGGWDGAARLWDWESGSPLGVLAGHEANVTAVALHADGRLATGGADGTVRLWDARRRQAERVLSAHEAEVTGLVFTPDGRFLFSASRDRSARAWDLRRGEAVRTLSHPDLVLGLALTPVATVLVTACADRCARLWHLDWEPETSAAATAATIPVTAARMTVKTRATAGGAPTSATTLREELRRAAPVAVPTLPRAARLSWRWVAAGLGVVGAIAIAWLAGRSPTAAVRLSPYMAQAVPTELNLVDLEPYLDGCSPGDYERHLERMRSGNPEARDVACLAAHGTAGVVADVLDGAPLDAPDTMTALRLRRNAASVLAGLRGEAVGAVCERLGDDREEARNVAAMALGLLDDPAALTCMRDTLAGGGPAALPAAAALRQRVARGLFPVADAWALTAALLSSSDPESRRAGLLLAPVFSGALAEPAVRPLLDDPDPDVAEAARRAHITIESALKTDRLRGDAR
jgi:WD40 repeat protein